MNVRASRSIVRRPPASAAASCTARSVSITPFMSSSPPSSRRTPSGSRRISAVSSEFVGSSGTAATLAPRSPRVNGRMPAPQYFGTVSEPNVDVVRRMFAAFAERDLAAMLPTMDEEVDFLPVSANITTGGVAYRGHEGIARYLEDVDRVWPQLRL